MTEPSLLLLIPAHNEEDRIEPVLRDYARYFQEQYHGKFQLVVVLNGCRDNTIGVVRRVAADFPTIGVLEFTDRIGKGGALIEGLKLAPLADLIGYVDADGATAPRAFHDLVKRIGEADCVIGSRWLDDSVVHQAQTGNRQVASRAFHKLVQLLFRMNIRDTQCGAKVMRREAVEKILPSLRIADMAFDINLLYSLKRAGFRILEVPTEWTDKMGSKIHGNLFRTSSAMALSALRIRIIYWPWLYNRLRFLRPFEGLLYKNLLRQPQPLPGPVPESASDKSDKPKS